MYFLYITLIPYYWYQFTDSPSDFEYKLSNIANNFEENIMNEDECKDLMNEASSIADEIDDEIEDTDENSSTEIAEFKKLKKKAEALEDYIGVVAGISTTFPTLDEFNTANSMVGGSIVNVSIDKFCVDIVSVTINDYIVYLAKNNTVSNYRISYSLKASNGMYSGSGEMAVTTKAYNHIYDNRDNPKQKTISVSITECKTF